MRRLFERVDGLEHVGELGPTRETGRGGCSCSRRRRKKNGRSRGGGFGSRRFESAILSSALSDADGRSPSELYSPSGRKYGERAAIDRREKGLVRCQPKTGGYPLGTPNGRICADVATRRCTMLHNRKQARNTQRSPVLRQSIHRNKQLLSVFRNGGTCGKGRTA